MVALVSPQKSTRKNSGMTLTSIADPKMMMEQMMEVVTVLETTVIAIAIITIAIAAAAVVITTIVTMTVTNKRNKTLIWAEPAISKSNTSQMQLLAMRLVLHSLAP